MSIFLRTCGAGLVVMSATACMDGSKSVLQQQAEAHRVSSDLRVQFARAADASNRAVMADTDEASTAAAREAGQSTQTVQRDIVALRTILDELGDRAEVAQLDQFKAKFDQYRTLDDAILPLAVENTNIKAQRLSFGRGQDAVTAFRQALAAAGGARGAKGGAAIELLVARAGGAVLEIQVLEARHIAESDDAAMSRLEAAMKRAGDAAQQAVTALRAQLPPAAAPSLASAAAALDQLTAVNGEIVALSRRNSNVRSLALSLGKKRTVTAECHDLLQSLEETLASHHFAATR